MGLVYPNESEMIEIKTKALEYADKSLNHTHEYDGFKNGDLSKKRARVVTGRIGQEWVYIVCKLNGISCKTDESHYSENDKYDIIVCGKVVDVKTSQGGVIPPQVAPNVEKSETDYYCFLETKPYPLDGHVNIIPIGVISKSDFFKVRTKVSKGELIPGTKSVRNSFHKPTNIIEMPDGYKHLLDFDMALRCLQYLSRITDMVHNDIQIALDIQREALVHKMAEHIGADDLSSKSGKLVRNHYDILDVISKILGPAIYPDPTEK